MMREIKMIRSTWFSITIVLCGKYGHISNHTDKASVFIMELMLQEAVV